MTRRCTRRRFLGGGAAAALGLPFLGNFARGGGLPAGTPRLVILWTPNDADWPDQWQVPLEPGAALPEALPSFLEPLAPFKDRVAVLGEIANVFEGGHTSLGHALTGIEWVGPDGNDFWANGVSVDQHIAQSLGEEALTLGVVCGAKNGKGRMSYSAPQQPVDPIEDPTIAFSSLFADVGADVEELAARRKRQHSILDRVAADLQAYEAQVPAEQRPRLQQHLESIRAIEETIDDELLASCNPTAPAVFDPNDNALVPAMVRAQMSILAQALACGATRVATLQIGRAGGGFTPLWPDEGLDIGLDVHGVAHEHYLQPDNAAVLADSRAVENWYSKQLAFLLQELDALLDVDGTRLLDNTLVVHVKELGRRHATGSMIYVVAGGAGLVTGNRYATFADRPHNDLLLTLCHKLGVMDETFGDAGITTGTIEI